MVFFREVARLQYGTGLRISELMSLRVKDFDWDRNQLVVRGGKGDKDRVTMLPATLRRELEALKEAARPIYDEDRLAQVAGVKLPNSLARKYPSAPTSWEWFWVLPSEKLSRDPECGTVRRHHTHPETYRRALRAAVKAAKIEKRVNPHVFRHSFATHSLDGRVHLRMLQELRGHAELSMTEVYTQVSSLTSDLFFADCALRRCSHTGGDEKLLQPTVSRPQRRLGCRPRQRPG